MKKKPKHPKDMTSNELMRRVFHPAVVKHIKKTANPKKESTKKG
jgi:hypothetical protein